MSTAIYVRVSTRAQANSQTIEQQLTRLLAHSEANGWQVASDDIFRDDGFSGSQLTRPGLDQLRDRVRLAEVARVLITAPDRLARNYVHQVLLLEEFERGGCQAEFLDRPMTVSYSTSAQTMFGIMQGCSWRSTAAMRHPSLSCSAILNLPLSGAAAEKLCPVL